MDGANPLVVIAYIGENAMVAPADIAPSLAQGADSLADLGPHILVCAMRQGILSAGSVRCKHGKSG